LNHEDGDSDEGSISSIFGAPFDELEEQTQLEEEYEQVQNAYFAICYREENGLGFLGTHKSVRGKAKAPAVTCRNCAASFTLNNKLHRHLHNLCKVSCQQPEAASLVVMESKAVIPSDPTEGLADFHYA